MQKYGVKSNDAPDRTNRQPPEWRCMTPECAAANGNVRHEWTGDHDTCPLCRTTGYPGVILKALLHFLIPDKNGQIKGKSGRFRMACNKGREYLATYTNQEGATNDLVAVTCPECLQVANRLGFERISPGGLVLPEAVEA